MSTITYITTPVVASKRLLLELLEALEALLHLYETPGDFTKDETAWVLEDAIIAIKRAKGG